MGYCEWADMNKWSQSKHNTLRFWLMVCAYLVAQHNGMTSVNIDMSINHMRFLISSIFLFTLPMWMMLRVENWLWKYSHIDTLIYVCISRYTQTSQSWTSCHGVYSVFPPHWCCLGSQSDSINPPFITGDDLTENWIRQMVVHIKF